MKILVLNASPKGKKSITLQTALYLQKRYPNHEYSFLDVGLRLKSFERDFSPVLKELEKAELIIFLYPIYTALAPFQLHKFIEIMKANKVDIKGKFAAQITTSKHFYDVTAYKCIEENCYDFGLKYLGVLSADMLDLQKEQGRFEADSFFKQLMHDIDKDIYTLRANKEITYKKTTYLPTLSEKTKKSGKDIVVVTNAAADDINLRNMINDFKKASSYNVREVNIRDFAFAGGCIGCLNCSFNGECIYKDGFETYLREEIQNADAFINAFTIENHYTHSSFKCYDDRQFCNGHRTLTHGKATGYIVSGDLSSEANLKTLIDARIDVSGMYSCGVATDETDTAKSIQNLASSLDFALNNKLSRPKSFYGVGGSKIFRDLVYSMQGLMREDHKYYKKTGVYDFPHNNKLQIYSMKLLGWFISIPAIKRKSKGKMSEFILTPYTKIIESTKEDIA